MQIKLAQKLIWQAFLGDNHYDKAARCWLNYAARLVGAGISPRCLITWDFNRTVVESYGLRAPAGDSNRRYTTGRMFYGNAQSWPHWSRVAPVEQLGFLEFYVQSDDGWGRLDWPIENECKQQRCCHSQHQRTL